jgi:hypothetical protein
LAIVVSLPWLSHPGWPPFHLTRQSRSDAALERRRILKKICMELPETPAPVYGAVLISPREQCYKDIETDKNGYWKPTKEALAEREARCQKLRGPEPEPAKAETPPKPWAVDTKE